MTSYFLRFQGSSSPYEDGRSTLSQDDALSRCFFFDVSPPTTDEFVDIILSLVHAFHDVFSLEEMLIALLDPALLGVYSVNGS